MDQPMSLSDFEMLVNLYYEDLYRFAWSLAHNPDDASDLTQQTFAIFAEKGHQIRETERAKSWLFTTLYREFIRNCERGKRTVSADASSTEIAEPMVESGIERQSDQSDLLRALAAMNDEPRAILSLFYLEQSSYKEIAVILDIPIGTVMSRLSRAKETLRKKFDSLDEKEGIKVIPIVSDQQRKEDHG